MSITSFFGFDMYGAAANAANTLPAHLAGIANTPYAVDLAPIVTSPGTHLVGVSGLDAHKLGSGARRRNGLVCHRPASSTNSSAAISLIRNFRGGAGTWDITIGMTMKVLSGFSVTQVHNLLSMGNTTTALSQRLLAINSNQTMILAGQNIPMVLELGREYYFEIHIYRKATDPVANLSVDLYVDGSLNASRGSFGFYDTTVTPLFISAGFIAQTVSTAAQTCIMGDIYISDSRPSGPQLVLPVRAESVVGGGWEKEGNGTPADVLNDGNDTTYYTSPTDAGELAIKLTSALDPEYPIGGMQLLVRSRRDVAAGRAMITELRKEDGSLVKSTTISNSATFTDYDVYKGSDLTAAEFAKATLRVKAVIP